MRINLLLPAIIVAVALPGSLAYLYFKTTGDPTLRPLGITREELAATFSDEHVLDITVQVDWGVDTKFTTPRAEVQRVLSRALQAVNVDHHFRFKDVPGDAVLITYVVGYNRFGPYRPGQAADGIRAAVAALSMERSPELRP